MTALVGCSSVNRYASLFLVFPSPRIHSVHLCGCRQYRKEVTKTLQGHSLLARPWQWTIRPPLYSQHINCLFEARWPPWIWACSTRSRPLPVLLGSSLIFACTLVSRTLCAPIAVSRGGSFPQSRGINRLHSYLVLETIIWIYYGTLKLFLPFALQRGVSLHATSCCSNVDCGSILFGNLRIIIVLIISARWLINLYWKQSIKDFNCFSAYFMLHLILF